MRLITLKDKLDYATDLCGVMAMVSEMLEHASKIPNGYIQSEAVTMLKKMEFRLAKEAKTLNRSIDAEKN